MINTGFGIFIIFAVFIAIALNSLKAIAKKEAKNNNSGRANNAAKTAQIKTIQSTPPAPTPKPKIESVVHNEMRPQLIEPSYDDYIPIKSQNEELSDAEYGEGFIHPASTSGWTENYEPYLGSLGVSYSGEGCEEHYLVRYVSDYSDPEEEHLNLTTLQKLVVFGEVINKPKFKQRINTNRD